MERAIKTMTFLRAFPGTDVASFQAWLRDDCVPRLLGRPNGASHCTVDLVVPQPIGAPYPKPDMDAKRAVSPRYHGLVQMWFDSPEHARNVGDALTEAVGERVDLRHEYTVVPTVIWNRQDVAVGKQTPGIKYLALLQFYDDMPDSVAKRCWGIHANLAAKVHVGCSRYVQNWVTGTRGASPTIARGMPELFFPSVEAFVQRFFDSPRGQDEIIHDVSHFVESGQRFFWQEYVLR